MLPKHLRRIKGELEAKGYTSRRREEDELLEELRFLDEHTTTLSKSLRESLTVTSGPGGVCPCCGR